MGEQEQLFWLVLSCRWVPKKDYDMSSPEINNNIIYGFGDLMIQFR